MTDIRAELREQADALDNEGDNSRAEVAAKLRELADGKEFGIETGIGYVHVTDWQGRFPSATVEVEKGEAGEFRIDRLELNGQGTKLELDIAGRWS